MDQEVYGIIEQSIDDAFMAFRFRLNLYDYFKVIKATRKDADDFISSSTSKEIKDLVFDLEEYLEGGQDNEHKQLREGYGHIPKPQARKIHKYLYALLEDAWKYEQTRRPGRKKKSK